jgi:uncharacterized protein
MLSSGMEQLASPCRASPLTATQNNCADFLKRRLCAEALSEEEESDLQDLLGIHSNVILGGALIGLALALLRRFTGRIMSASAMIGSLLGGREGLAAASIAFLAGLFIGPSILLAIGMAAPPPAETFWPFLVIGGLLLGLGARLGEASLFGAISGLTHRSWRAVTTFLAMLTGAGLSLALRQFLNNGGVA